ncbi:MAG: TlpA family protein disulfide reductase [Bacteroidaceae bacterium]|nr:TlpA family protein disulfide reductase [Bacteroidaceae bacterium]
MFIINHLNEKSMKKLPLSLILAATLGVVGCQKTKTAVAETGTEDTAVAEATVETGNQEGQMFVDFEATYEGKTTKLSDYVGKGRYVLADFWASWCGPCRMEVPNLIAVHDKYAGDKFTVLGVATWDEPADTKAAVDELGINYPQMLNAQQAGSDAYDIEGIPEIILFAPDGTILARGLRGEAIEKAVSEALASCE